MCADFRRWPSIVTTLLAVSFVASARIEAQSARASYAADPVAGDTIRIRVAHGDGYWKRLRVTGVDAQTIVGVTTADSVPFSILRDSVSAIQRYLGERTRWEAVQHNAGRAVIIGATTTAALVLLALPQRNEQDYVDPVAFAVVGGGMFTVGVMYIAATIAVISPGEKWERLPVARRVALQPIVRRSEIGGWQGGVRLSLR